MIPFTADELRKLVEARDVLALKAISPEPYQGICDAVHNSILMILKNAHVELEGPLTVPDNPLVAPAHGAVLQGDSDESPAGVGGFAPAGQMFPGNSIPGAIQNGTVALMDGDKVIGTAEVHDGRAVFQVGGRGGQGPGDPGEPGNVLAVDFSTGKINHAQGEVSST